MRLRRLGGRHAAVERRHERQRAHEVRRDRAHQQRPLARGLPGEAPLAVLEVAQAAVDELGAPAARAVGEVAALEQRDRQPARGGVERDAGARDAAADHDEVDRLARGERVELRGAARGVERCAGHGRRYPSTARASSAQASRPGSRASTKPRAISSIPRASISASPVAHGAVAAAGLELRGQAGDRQPLHAAEADRDVGEQQLGVDVEQAVEQRVRVQPPRGRGDHRHRPLAAAPGAAGRARVVDHAAELPGHQRREQRLEVREAAVERHPADARPGAPRRRRSCGARRRPARTRARPRASPPRRVRTRDVVTPDGEL